MTDIWNKRTELLIGKEQIENLKIKNVLIAGLGGVGSYAAEMICRAGIGNITIVDHDTISVANINRQLHALYSNIGKYKTDVMAKRLMDINPELNITKRTVFLKDNTHNEILLEQKYDYVIDAIDTLSPKIYLIYHALQNGMKVVSALGSGAKFDPLKITVCDISETYKCRLAYYVRKHLHKLGIQSGFNVVFSPEDCPKSATVLTDNELNKKSIVGTISYMPSIFGCICASVVIRDFIGK